MELAEGGNLSERIHDPHKRRMELLEVLQTCRDIACGLSHLHPLVIHGDLKPQNILLDRQVCVWGGGGALHDTGSCHGYGVAQGHVMGMVWHMVMPWVWSSTGSCRGYGLAQGHAMGMVWHRVMPWVWSGTRSCRGYGVAQGQSCHGYGLAQGHAVGMV